jgi:hypothetical protein
MLNSNYVHITGMDIFLKDTAFFGVLTNSLFSMSPEWKEALHLGIQDGIKRGVVQPLEFTVFPRQQAQLAFRCGMMMA